MPCTHHFMATLFTRILQTGEPPSSWSECRITLIYKKKLTNDPANFRMISLSSCVGKIFHQALADRFDTFIKDNNLIDTSFQKAFLKGKNGCIEHNQVIHEVIRDAKHRKRTVHMTWFDLEDAFGSVPHDLIHLTLSRNKFPPAIRQYILNLYSSLKGTVVTKSWQSRTFCFKKGIFQGDPLSPLIFILCFNPLIQELENNLDHGYDLNGKKFITAPFADDFCLISNNRKTHQRLIKRISELSKSMGLKLKPSKCRSLSIVSGKATSIEYSLDESNIPTLEKEPHKFLGSLLTFDNKEADVFEYLKNMIADGLSNIDKALVRPEFKLRMYSDYFLPSLRFHLTVNDIYATHLKELDALSDRYLKKWCGLPRPGTLAFVHMAEGLNIKSVSTLYQECHTSAYISSRTKADSNVNHCLDTQLSRESEWSRKISQIVQSENILNEVNESIPEANLKQKQKKAKDILQNNVSEDWNSHVKSLVVQGRFLELMAAEERNFDWKSVVYNLPHRISKFVINSVSDTLNTKANLVRWGKSMNSKCTACGNHETLHHILNNCTKFLDQGRYTWRHNNVLKFIYDHLKTSVKEGGELYCDLEGEKGWHSTVPIECTVTNLIPDICVFFKDTKKLTVIELSVPFELNIKNAHTIKTNKYSPLISDIRQNGIEVDLIALEIGSRGYIDDSNMKNLKEIHKLIDNSVVSFKDFKNSISKLAIISSFVIFTARSDPTWNEYQTLLYK